MGLSSWAVHSSNEGPTFAPNGVVFPMGGGTSLVIPLADAVDMSGALERLEKDLQKIEKEWGTLEKRLHEAQSRPQTPEEIVEDLQVRCQEKQSMLEHIRATILAITKSL
jgi:valyl-tRNA synthetase